MWPNPQFLVTFTEEIRNKKKVFLRSAKALQWKLIWKTA